MANRLFLSLSDEELRCFETARELLGMNRSQYLRYLMTDQKEIRPVELTHRELIQKLSCIERDLKVIAMKKELGEQERILLMERVKELKQIWNGELVVNLATSGKETDIWENGLKK